MLMHRAAHAVRVPLEWAVNRWPSISNLFWAFTHGVYMRGADQTPFVDELGDYTFFMDGNLRAARAAARFGMPFPVAQATWMIPAAADVGPFLSAAIARLERANISIALADALWMPADEGFHLSSTRAGAGFACTLSFEGSFDRMVLRRELAALSRDVAQVRGRVHLGKNVAADPDLLARTYECGLARYAAVKGRVDPTTMIQSEFLRRCFPSLF